MNKRRSVSLTPKLYVALILICIGLIGLFNLKDMIGQISNVLACVFTGFVFDTAVAIYQKRKQWFPDGGIVTGLIIAMVLGAATPWYSCSLITLIALLSKHLLKYKRKPFVNPAAFGLWVGSVSFATMQNWWGGLSMLPAWCMIFVLIGGYLVADRVNKFPQVFAFLGIYFLLQLFLGVLHVGDAADAIRPPFVNSTLFLAFFMLTDPPTSPTKYKDQIVFGIIAAVAASLIYAIFGWLGYLLVGLLTANLWHFISSRVAAEARTRVPFT